MSVADDLRFAIENRRVVTFIYDGNHRVVEPFLLGVTTAGKPALRLSFLDKIRQQTNTNRDGSADRHSQGSLPFVVQFDELLHRFSSAHTWKL